MKRVVCFGAVAIAMLAAVRPEATRAATSGDDQLDTRLYVGTRDVRHTVESRTTRRSGNTVFENETRSYTMRSGGDRAAATAREVIVRDEHFAGRDELVLDEYFLDRATFGYVGTVAGTGQFVPFDGVDREATVETFDTPPVVYAATRGDRSNVAARSVETKIYRDAQDAGSGQISERVSADGTVRGSRTTSPATASSSTLTARASRTRRCRDSTTSIGRSHRPRLRRPAGRMRSC